jgi:hypothetical protein
MGYPCRMIPRNVFDLATITCTIPCYATTPLVNLKQDRRARIARWPAASGTQQIFGTWGGQGFVVGGWSLDRFNLSPAALIRIRGYANADWTGTVLLDSGSIAPYNAAALGSFAWGLAPLGSSIYDGYLGYKYSIGWFTSRPTIASFLIEITDTTNSDQVIDLSRVVVGDYIEPGANATFGIRAGYRTLTAQDESDGGSLFSDRKLPRRVITATLENLTATERRDVYDLTRYVDKGKSFLISFQAGEGASMDRDFTIPRAKFADTMPDIAWIRPLEHAMQFTIVEA